MTARLTAFVAECQSQGNFSTTECTAKRNSDSLYFFYYVLFQSFQIISYSKPIIFIFLSIFSTSAICIKVVKNAKFQLKHNRADFISSIRIAAVFCLQIFVNFIVLVIEYISLIEKWLINVYGLKAFTWKYQVPAGKDPKEYWDFRLPLWLNGDYGLVSDPARQMLSQFRVFTESIIVLFLMTGYREALVKFVKFIFAAIENPKNAYHRFKSRITQTKVTSIAVNSIK
uniref:Anoctamin n=1 Tax=Panagrolaimus davidi TaxID=227884 RepID=A0A914Q4Y6_9BILA